MADTRHANPELQLDVDLIILEYILYKATKALLDTHQRAIAENQAHSRKRKRGNSNVENERSYAKAPSETLVNHLNMVESFLNQFKTKHPKHTPSPALSFRLTVLQFTTLYTLRHSLNSSTPTRASLSGIRHSNTQRARQWLRRAAKLNENDQLQGESYKVFGDRPGRSIEASVAAEVLDADVPMNGAHACNSSNEDIDMDIDVDVDVGEESRVCDSQGQEPPTLLDLIPSFVELAAKRVSMFEDAHEANGKGRNLATPRKKNPDFALSAQWLELAGEMMLQAALEAQARHENGDYRQGAEEDPQSGVGSKIMEAFAWGPVPARDDGVEARNERDDNDLHDKEASEDTQLNDIFLIREQHSSSSSQSSDDDTDNANALSPHPWLSLRSTHLRSVLPLNPPTSYSVSYHAASSPTGDEGGGGGRSSNSRSRLAPSNQPLGSSPITTPQEPPNRGVPTRILAHLCAKARLEYPVDEFEKTMSDYLNAMGESVGVPVLVQIERAVGVTEAEGGRSGGQGGHDPRGNDRGKGKGKAKANAKAPQLEIDGKPLDARTTERLLHIFRMGIAGMPSKKEAGERA